MALEAETKTPPLEWYLGIALPGEGIRMITLSSTFYALNTDLHEQMGNWGHTQFYHGKPDTSQFHIDAGACVQEITGFTPEAVMNFRSKLEEIYLGQSMGPFPFPVEWIIRNFT